MTISRQILTDATSGESSEFLLPDNSLILKLAIVGTSLTPINAFICSAAINKNLVLTINGVNNGGAYVKLQAKPNNSNASFTDTGDIWYNDVSDICYFQ
jgi:hypothetical protein